MKPPLLLLFFSLVVATSAHSQIRLAKLELKAREIYKIEGSDILVIDTLIMHDSSSIVLSHEKKENFIHSKKIIVGKACRIDGSGDDGKPGMNGAKGLSGEGPCRDGQLGRNGLGGSHGENGINLFLYCNDLQIKGSLIIDLSGGDGGNGGKGGEGGGGSPGTRVCQGGNGGSGGNGSTGGNGGNGANLLISCKGCPDLLAMLNRSIFAKSYAGRAGLGGDAGAGGFAGLNPAGDSKQDGKKGLKGKAGADGLPGKSGAINFERN